MSSNQVCGYAFTPKALRDMDAVSVLASDVQESLRNTTDEQSLKDGIWRTVGNRLVVDVHPRKGTVEGVSRVKT